jgi:hypothetical protein
MVFRKNYLFNLWKKSEYIQRYKELGLRSGCKKSEAGPGHTPHFRKTVYN